MQTLFQNVCGSVMLTVRPFGNPLDEDTSLLLAVQHIN